MRIAKQAAILILLFPIWLPMALLILSWVVASEVSQIVMDKVDIE